VDGLRLDAPGPEASPGSPRASCSPLTCFSRPVSSKGAWRPSLSIATLLTSIQLLMAEPNPDDPLMADIVRELLFLPCGRSLGRSGALGRAVLPRHSLGINALAHRAAASLSLDPAWGRDCVSPQRLGHARWGLCQRGRSWLQACRRKRQRAFLKRAKGILRCVLHTGSGFGLVLGGLKPALRPSFSV